MAFIYKIYNDINNNLYIGETIRPIEKRWAQHKDKAKDTNITGHLQLAMRKYGIDKFHIKIIEECPDNDRFNRERYWIAYYNSYEDGYNSTYGGEGTNEYNYDEIYELWLNGENVEQICKNIHCCNATVQNALRSKGIKYIDHVNRTFAKPVIQYDKSGGFIARYNSANEAGRAMGRINGTNIIKCCKGEIKTSLGYIWKYEDDNTTIEELVQTRKKRTTGKIVLQFDLENNFIAEYESCEKAGKALNKSGSVINRCARGERKTAYGYKWKYKDI